jgi:hypothetical protein
VEFSFDEYGIDEEALEISFLEDDDDFLGNSLNEKYIAKDKNVPTFYNNLNFLFINLLTSFSYASCLCKPLTIINVKDMFET